MTGREENTIKIERKIESKLKNDPEILTTFYWSLINKTAKTKEVYINYVRNYLKFIGEDYLTAKPSDLNRYLKEFRYYTDRKGNHKTRGASIQRANMAAISCFYNFLIAEDMLDKNPCDKVVLPTENKELKVVAMTPLEIQQVKENIMNDTGSKWRKRDYAIFTLGCTTGLRVTAISEINMEDLDLENCKVTVVEKGNKQRTVFFGKNTAEVLQDWIDERDSLNKRNSDALFFGTKTARISPDTISDMLAKYTKDLDKHITPHKMRSSCATNLYQQTRDIYLVQNVLGHSNIENTKRYAGLSEENRREAASILDNL